jgi:hypothetical protein
MTSVFVRLLRGYSSASFKAALLRGYLGID